MSAARRPGGLRDQMRTGMARPNAAERPVPAEQPTGEPASKPEEQPSKFTVLLDAEEAAGFDQLALDVRRLLGRRVAKGDLVRALVALASDDVTLRDQVVAELRGRPPRRK